MKFALFYLLAAFAGTAGVYYGAQPLWLAVGMKLPAAHAAAPSVAPSVPTDPYVRSSASSELSGSQTATARAPRLARVPDGDESGAAATPAAPMTRSNSPTSPATAPADNTAPLVAGKPLPPPTQGSKAWAMLTNGASYYALSGENRGQLPGGTVMDIEDKKDTDKGEMSLGQVERNDTMVGPYLVANADLVRFNMSRSEVPTETVALLKQYYSLKGQLAQRIADIKKQAVSANPFAAAYADAAQNYNSFGQREKTLTAKRDAASGADRMRYVDTLREMIPEGQRLLRKVEDTKARYNKWKADNPHTPTADTVNDAQAQELRRQIAALEPKVKEIVQ